MNSSEAKRKKYVSNLLKTERLVIFYVSLTKISIFQKQIINQHSHTLTISLLLAVRS